MEQLTLDLFRPPTGQSPASVGCSVLTPVAGPSSLEKHRLALRKWRINNPERSKELNNKWHRENAELVKKIIRISKLKHIDRVRRYDREWAKTHRENKNRFQRKYRNTVKGKLDHSISTLMNRALKGKKAGRRWESLVGYTTENLIKHLESLFYGGMSWDNMSKWHLDHIIPRSFFIYDKPEDMEFQFCWSLDNLRPLWAKDNLSKNKKTDSEWKKHQQKIKEVRNEINN